MSARGLTSTERNEDDDEDTLQLSDKFVPLRRFRPDKVFSSVDMTRSELLAVLLSVALSTIMPKEASTTTKFATAAASN